MNLIYEWLYDQYARPRLADIRLSSVYYIQEQEWRTVAEKLSTYDRLLSCDLMSTLKHDWGTLAFACGIQMGLSLAVDPLEREE